VTQFKLKCKILFSFPLLFHSYRFHFKVKLYPHSMLMSTTYNYNVVIISSLGTTRTEPHKPPDCP